MQPCADGKRCNAFTSCMNSLWNTTDPSARTDLLLELAELALDFDDDGTGAQCRRIRCAPVY